MKLQQGLNNQPSFGMALYMNESKIAKELGHYAEAEAKKARPQLEELFKDVDGFVLPEKHSSRVDYNKLNIYVQDITPEPLKSKNPIVNFIRDFKELIQTSPKPHTEGMVFISNGDVSKTLARTAEATKESFLLSK